MLFRKRVAATERVKVRKRARVERGAGDVPMEPGNGEQMADRHAVTSGEDERQHDENIMSDIYIGKRGPETAHEEQPDKVQENSTFKA